MALPRHLRLYLLDGTPQAARAGHRITKKQVKQESGRARKFFKVARKAKIASQATSSFRSQTLATQSASRLLNIPPELRNRIYEFALLELGSVQVTAHLKPPAFLQACHQIRCESLKIWYSNRFNVEVVNCDATLYLRWLDHTDAVRGPNTPFDISAKVLGRDDWDNLVAWIHALYDRGGYIRFANNGNYQSVMNFVVAAHDLLVYFGGKSVGWEAIEGALEALRFAVSGYTGQGGYGAGG